MNYLFFIRFTQKLAIKYFLYILDTHTNVLNLEQITFCLSRLSAICVFHKKFDEALRFRNAERLIYESQLLTLDLIDRPAAETTDPASS